MQPVFVKTVLFLFIFHSNRSRFQKISTSFGDDRLGKFLVLVTKIFGADQKIFWFFVISFFPNQSCFHSFYIQTGRVSRKSVPIWSDRFGKFLMLIGKFLVLVTKIFNQHHKFWWPEPEIFQPPLVGKIWKKNQSHY